ncbi:hypothetical protein CcaverHIS002_0312510 [Cutaneotrichosporon cavernicola]|nr:hypothetical protein CcaverHIS002_0312510 [Cutaneotrichosporon cavernicola]BEJ06718.1 hypothetical protein CcaverHIS641_0312400 [Cutaneotrichosporon cavernicola]
MSMAAFIGAAVGGVVGLGLVGGSAWVGYRLARRKHTEQLELTKADVEAPAIRSIVPIPMPGAWYEPPVPVIVAAHTGWGPRQQPRAKYRRMMRSPARRASETALPTLLELGESEFGDSEGPEHHGVSEGERERGSVNVLGFSLACSEEGESRTGTCTDAELTPSTLRVPPDPHLLTGSSSEDESDAMPSEGSADSDCCSAMQADLRPPEAPPSLSSIPVTPATSVSFGPDDFVLAFERQSLGNTPSDSDESTESTPTSSPEGTIERPKRRVCVELELGSNRRSLSAFIGRPYV